MFLCSKSYKFDMVVHMKANMQSLVTVDLKTKHVTTAVSFLLPIIIPTSYIYITLHYYIIYYFTVANKIKEMLTHLKTKKYDPEVCCSKDNKHTKMKTI